MKKQLSMLAICFMLLGGCSGQTTINPDYLNPPPSFLLGRFIDDYGIKYTISEKAWLMEPNQTFEILEWYAEGQFALAKNHRDNGSDANLYTRIDFMQLDDEMKPFSWGFCFSTFNAESPSEAKAVSIADRENPKSGCNGYPFSRMKKLPSED